MAEPTLVALLVVLSSQPAMTMMLRLMSTVRQELKLTVELSFLQARLSPNDLYFITYLMLNVTIQAYLFQVCLENQNMVT